MPTVVRTVKGNEYTYFRRYNRNKHEHEDQYLGRSDDPDVKKQSKVLEKKHKEMRINRIRRGLDNL